MEINAALKEPWVKYSVFGVVGIGLVLIVARHMSTGGASAVATADPNAAALAGQYAQLQQAAASQSSQQSYNLAMGAQSANAQLAALQLTTQADLAKTHDQDAAQLAIANLAARSQDHAADLAANTTVSLANIQQQAAAVQAASVVALGNIQATNTAQISLAAQKATTDQAAILAHTQETIAGINAGVAVTQSNNAANVAITQSNNAVNASNTASNNAKSASNTSSWLSTAASVAGLVASFF